MSVTAPPLRRLVCFILLCAVFALTGCSASVPAGAGQSSAKPSPSSMDSVPDDKVAVVGGKTITRAELTDRLMSGYGAAALREMMLHEAVNLEAASLGLGVSADELDGELSRMSDGYGSESQFYSSMQQQLGLDRNAVVEDAKQRLLLEKLATRGVTVPEADIASYYEEHKQFYAPGRQFKLAWIVTATKDEAAKVLSQLQTGADFGSLARDFSIDAATADSGGNLGWIDDTDPLQDARILSAAGQLNVGETAGPIHTDQGYAVLELMGAKTSPLRDLASVRDEIRRQLAMDQAVPIHDLEQTLLAKYQAKIFDAQLQSGSTP